MSTYVGKLLTSISSALEFNTATLSGAIDIIVIEDDTGRRQCSPFHVRFGKLQLLKSRGIPVSVELNGCPTNLRMLLGAAGEAYFYRPSQVEPSVADEISDQSILAESSPVSIASTPQDARSTHARDEDSKRSSSSDLLKEPMALGPEHVPHTADTTFHPHHHDHFTSHLTSDYSFAYISDSEVELTRNERDGTSEVVDEPRSPPVNSYQRKWNSVVVQNYDVTPPPETQLITPPCIGNIPEDRNSAGSSFDRLSIEETHSKNPFNIDDHAVNSSSLVTNHAQGATKSEEQLDEKRFGASMTVPNSMSEVVGQEDAKMECRSIDEQGSEDRFEELQQRVAGVLSDSSPSSEQDDSFELCEKHNAREDSGDYVTSLRRSFLEKLHIPLEEVTYSSPKDEVLAMSLCGHLLSSDMKEDEILELFERHRVSFSDFERQPTLLFDPALVVKIENRLVEFRVAAAFVFSLLSFRGKVDIDTLAKLLAKEQKNEPVKSPPTPLRRFRWFGWSSPAVEGEPLLQQVDLDVLDEMPASTSETVLRDQRTMGMELSTDLSDPQQTKNEMNETLNTKFVPDDRDLEHQDPNSPFGIENANVESGNQYDYDESKPSVGVCFSEIDPEALSLRPSEEELMQLDLKPGANAIRFIVQSSSVELSCRVFLWNCHTKIVISDVDGTITRSDVLGHLLPAVGRDWSQVGVAGLYTQIEKNGYKVLYLTARPIGQASQTRSFLHNVTQGSAKLPNGPVLMSPNRLVESFTREVIHRKPHEFKITALREIRSLFPPDYNPFHAGFGNRDSDVISYRAVGLIPQRIFVVNPKGELVVTKARYESTASYSTLQDLVESVFPDISRQSGLDKVQAVTESASFNDWNFWKGTLPEVDVDSFLQNETGA